MDWWKAKHPEVPVIVKTAWCRLAMNTPAAECWVTYHPDFPANGGEGVYNAWPKTDFYGKEMPECRVHAEAECVNLNAEREAWLKSPKPEPPPPPIPLVARHCRTCGLVQFGRSRVGVAPFFDRHRTPPEVDPNRPSTTRAPWCDMPDFGPESVVAVVPW